MAYFKKLKRTEFIPCLHFGVQQKSLRDGRIV